MRLRLVKTSLVLFALLAALLILGWTYIQAREREHLLQSLQSAAQRVAARAEERIHRHVAGLPQLARDLLRHPTVDRPTFRAASRSYLDEHAGLQALNWVSADGKITWVSPEEPNRGALGYDLDEHPIASESLAAARASPEIAVTRPLELLQGGWGVATYYRLERDGVLVGFLNAVFRLPDLLTACLNGASDDGSAFLLHDGDTLLGALGPTPDDLRDLPVAKCEVRIGSRTLVLSVVSRPRNVPASATWVDEALLLSGLALAAGLAWLVRVARQRRQTAEAAASKLRVLIDNSPDAILAIDPETGAIVGANRRATTLFERSSDELSRSTVGQLCRPLDVDETSVQEFLENALARARTEPVEFPCSIPTGRDQPRVAEVHLVHLPSLDGPQVRASVLDVSDQHDLQQQLRRTASTEAMGHLAGGVAHDFNNLLTAILANCELIETQQGVDPAAQGFARAAIEACNRAATLTRQLLAFSRHSAIKPSALDLNELVAGIVPMLARMLGERVTIHTDLRATRAVLADQTQAELMLMNLAVNARDAMPHGGRISIGTRDVGEHEVEVSVRDEGDGVPEDLMDQVFEPYFTTKRPGAGTGIGLATVKRIAEQAGGNVSVASEAGAGALFRVVLPEHVGPARRIPQAPPAALQHGQAVVLLVEDDETVRGVVEGTLREAGYEVVIAEDAESALAVAAKPIAIDCVIADIVLPGSSGPELVKTMKRGRPEVRCLLMSGYAPIESRLDDPELADVDFLAKPFSASQLTRRLGALFATDI